MDSTAARCRFVGECHLPRGVILKIERTQNIAVAYVGWVYDKGRRRGREAVDSIHFNYDQRASVGIQNREYESQERPELELGGERERNASNLGFDVTPRDGSQFVPSRCWVFV